VKAAAAALAALLALPLVVVVLVFGTAGSGQATAPATTPAALNLAGPGGAVSGSAGQLQVLAARLAAGYGWTGQQDTCLDELWTRESGWSATAINPSSGAYGVAQALGHVLGVSVAQNRQGYNYPPPYTAGNPAPWGDSDAAAQISWGLQYIQGAYGSPCGAWAHEEAVGFY
jgi:hypothetical protein